MTIATTEAIPNGAFAALRDEQFVVLTTFRASGVAVPTTVWFALVGERIYITTNAHSAKVRRIRANPQVQLAPSDRVGVVHGPAIAAQARALDPAAFAPAAAALREKYGDAYVAMTSQMDARQAPGSRMFIEVVPQG